jgi:hypothetical protein
MSTLQAPAPIVPGTLYTLSDFQQVTGLKRHSMREARNNGLKVRRIGRRVFIHSDDFLAYVDEINKQDDQSNTNK